MKRDCPCNGCEKPIRHIGCHGTCKRFKDWRAEIEADHKAEYKERLVTMQLYDMAEKRKNTKRRHKPESLKHGRKVVNK